MPRRRSAVPAPLKHALREFESWRRTRTTRKIPDELWNLAVESAAEFGVHRSARTLRLDYATLKRRVQSRADASAVSIPEHATFVEVVPPGPETDCVVEIESERGARLRIQLRAAGVREVAALASSLWKAES